MIGVLLFGLPLEQKDCQATRQPRIIDRLVCLSQSLLNPSVSYFPLNFGHVINSLNYERTFYFKKNYERTTCFRCCKEKLRQALCRQYNSMEHLGRLITQHAGLLLHYIEDVKETTTGETELCTSRFVLEGRRSLLDICRVSHIWLSAKGPCTRQSLVFPVVDVDEELIQSADEQQNDDHLLKGDDVALCWMIWPTLHASIKVGGVIEATASSLP